MRRRSHLGISDEALLEQIKKDPAFKDADGQFQPGRICAGAAIHRHERAGYLNSTARAQSAPADSHHRRQGGEQPRDPDRRARTALMARPARCATCSCRQAWREPSPIRPKRISSATTKIIRRKYTQPEYPQGRRSRRHARDGQRPGHDHRGRSEGGLRSQQRQARQPGEAARSADPLPRSRRRQCRLSEDPVRHRFRGARQGNELG